MSTRVVLDKSLFDTSLRVLGLRVEAKKIGAIVQKLHGHLLNKPKLRNVVPDPANPDPYKNTSSKLVLLNESIQDKHTLSPLSSDLVDFVKEQNVDIVEHDVKLTYDYFSVDHVLHKLLPADTEEIPSSFEGVGHIAHLNLRDHLLPYKNVIGQVIVDKNRPQIRTCVNKTSNIETEFRTFPMEVLAGEDNLNVTVRESGATFKFNYAEVYWNSRLQQEHLRLIRKITASKRLHILDMMCGVGPFAIPLALQGCYVYANDLNPKSFEYLEKNIRLNKVSKTVEAFNLDGRKAVQQVIEAGKKFDHVIMNLPASALEFLDVFNGAFDGWEATQLPTIHCYCFSTADDVEADVLERASHYLGGQLSRDDVEFHQVRDVAPKKVMMCISIQLPSHIAFPSSKRRKVESKD